MLVEIFWLTVVINSGRLVSASWAMIPLRHYFGNDINLSLFWCNKVMEVAGIVACATWTTCNSLFYPTFYSCKDFLHAIHVRILLIPHGSHATIHYCIIAFILKVRGWLGNIVAIGNKIESFESSFLCPLLEPSDV